MPLYDLSPDELVSYRPEVAEPDDFDTFWRETLEGARARATPVVRTPVDTPLTVVDVDDVTFPGFDGQPVKAWLTLPRGRSGPLPTVVHYNGYGGGRGLPHQHLLWAAAGYAYLFMDTRGQGSTWGDGGHTPDPVGSGPAHPGVMTQGVEDPHDHYYRRLFTDAVRAVDAVRTFPEVDATRVAVTGGSQGGGTALAVAGLVPDLWAVMADVPFLCHIRRAVGLVDSHPYGEITKFLSINRNLEEATFRTLSYIDGVNHARRATAPLLASVALRDPICPPSTVYAAYNHYGRPGSRGASDRTMEVYPHNEHEGGGGFQEARQLEWLAALAARDAGTTEP